MESANSSTQRLPITLPILQLLRPEPGSHSYDECLRWAAATMCFFGFFRAVEITVPSASTFDQRVHLAWGDVSISDDGRALRVRLKRSKTDQFMRGVEVFIGATGNDVCPIAATREYVARRGTQQGAFFRFADGTPLTKPRFVGLVRSALTQARVPVDGYILWAQF